MEIWQDIPLYGGIYQASSLGRVRSGSGSLVAQRLDKYGYPRVTLGKKGSRRAHRVHSLVLLAFVGPRPDGMECRHLNGVRGDARLENLAWGSSLENKRDMARHGTVLAGEKHPMAKLTPEQVAEIRSSGSIRKNAKKFGMSERQITKIRSGRSWKEAA